jgi:hypothetical protein
MEQRRRMDRTEQKNRAEAWSKRMEQRKRAEQSGAEQKKKNAAEKSRAEQSKAEQSNLISPSRPCFINTSITLHSLAHIPAAISLPLTAELLLGASQYASSCTTVMRDMHISNTIVSSGDCMKSANAKRIIRIVAGRNCEATFSLTRLLSVNVAWRMRERDGKSRSAAWWISRSSHARRRSASSGGREAA